MQDYETRKLSLCKSTQVMSAVYYYMCFLVLRKLPNDMKMMRSLSKHIFSFYHCFTLYGELKIFKKHSYPNGLHYVMESNVQWAPHVAL